MLKIDCKQQKLVPMCDYYNIETLPFINVYVKDKLVLSEKPDEQTETKINEILYGKPKPKEEEEFSWDISPSPLLIEYSIDPQKSKK